MVVMCRFVGGPCGGIVKRFINLQEPLEHILIKDGKLVHVYDLGETSGPLADYDFVQTLSEDEVDPQDLNADAP